MKKLSLALVAVALSPFVLGGCPRKIDADNTDAAAVVSASAAVSAPVSSASVATSASAKAPAHAKPAFTGLGPTMGGPCKPGQKVVMAGAATLRECATPCKSDADCKEQYSTCDTTRMESDFNDQNTSFHRCVIVEAEVPKGSAMEFPNPKKQKCPAPYTNMESDGKQVCFMRTPKTM